MEELARNNGLQILTDSGWEDFTGVLKKGIRQTVKIVTQRNVIECTLDHELFDFNMNRVTAASLKPGDKLTTVDGIERVVSVSLSSANQQVYDILNAGKNHRFYANELLVSNCQFIIESETLIDAAVLASLKSTDAIYKTGQVRWFAKPQKGKVYVVALDPSLGTGGDYAAIQVVEANTTNQIAEWRHNKTPIPDQIKLLSEICSHIFEHTKDQKSIYWSLENNTIGEAAIISINDYGEEKIPGIWLSEPKKAGQTRRYRRGFTTTNKTKLAACAKMKSLIESERMKVNSSALISELKTFIATGGSYAARTGDTDDLVSSMLLAVNMLQYLKTYYAELDKHLTDHSEVIEPMPFILESFTNKMF